MPAPKGNKFWEARSSHGRNPKFETKEDLWDACSQYFEWVSENPLTEAIVFQGQLSEDVKPLPRAMTIGALCLFIGIDSSTWAEYRKKKDFSGIANEVDQIIRAQKFEGAAAGLFNPNIIARDLGLAEKAEVHVSPLQDLLTSIDGKNEGLPNGDG